MAVILFCTSAVLVFLSFWIVLPAPNIPLLAIGVGAPELSPALFANALVLVVLGATVASGAMARVAVAVALVAASVAAVPLARYPGTVRRFDDAMRQVVRNVDRDPHVTRASTFSVRDFLLGIPARDARSTRGVMFARPAESSLTVDVHRPPADGRYPVLVQIYGGAWQRGAPADDEAFARHFAALGYVVFAIDYRHAPRWQWPAQIDDVRAALAWTAAHAAEYGGDASKVAIIGRSAGAQLALVSAYSTHTPDVSAVVSYYGPTDLVEGWRMPPAPDPLGVRPTLEAYLGGTPDSVPSRYREASPVTYVSGRLPPTLLIYGSRDHIVEARFGRELHERLRGAGATSVLLEIPWAEHAFDAVPRGLSGQLSLYYTERFLAWALARAG